MPTAGGTRTRTPVPRPGSHVYKERRVSTQGSTFSEETRKWCGRALKRAEAFPLNLLRFKVLPYDTMAGGKTYWCRGETNRCHCPVLLSTSCPLSIFGLALSVREWTRQCFVLPGENNIKNISESSWRPIQNNCCIPVHGIWFCFA